jgi:hypothetical protein
VARKFDRRTIVGGVEFVIVRERFVFPEQIGNASQSPQIADAPPWP